MKHRRTLCSNKIQEPVFATAKIIHDIPFLLLYSHEKILNGGLFFSPCITVAQGDLIDISSEIQSLWEKDKVYFL